MYLKLFRCLVQIREEFHFNNFELRDGELYYKGRSKPLTTIKGDLRSVGEIAEILGKRRLHNLGFDIPKGEVTARQAIMLNKVEEELPSAPDIAKADDKELQEITESATKSTWELCSTIRRAGNATHAQAFGVG